MTDYIIIGLLALLVFQNTTLDERLGAWLRSLPRRVARLYRRVFYKSLY